MLAIKYLSLQKINLKSEIIQKHNPSKNDIIDLLNLKSPTIITGEVENWFIFSENDTINQDKLNNKTLNENTSNLIYIFPLVKKYNLNTFKNKYRTDIIRENNTRLSCMNTF
tara:strand:- start:158 stop:493 length:336 start_codon:yes stop_codon:yes gene_type:complete